MRGDGNDTGFPVVLGRQSEVERAVAGSASTSGVAPLVGREDEPAALWSAWRSIPGAVRAVSDRSIVEGLVVLPSARDAWRRDEAARLVLERLDKYPNLTVACQTVAGRLGFGSESLRRWVRQTQIDAGDRHGVSSSESERNRALQRESRELREANAILKDAAVFLAGELDPRRR